MNFIRFLVVLVAFGVATTSLACDYPALITIPDGQTSTMAEMVSAQSAVTEYLAAMDGYIDCVSDEIVATGDDAPAEYKSIMYSRHNTAVAEMEAVATMFNEQIAAFYDANPPGPRPGGMGAGG